MRVTNKQFFSCVLATIVVSGCLTLGGSSSIAQPRDELDQYTLIDQVGISASGCNYRYRIYRPNQPRSQTQVIFGHGFMRNQNTLIDMARTMANEGIQVATMDFCNMRPWNGHHRKNAADMQDLARQMDIESDVIYAGFSAGALAAVLASNDKTRAVLALDLVDQNELGLNAINQSSTPLVGLSGDASSCNAQGNGATLFSSREPADLSSLTTISGASHCEFESPSNWLCELACGDNDSGTVAASTRLDIIRTSIDNISPFLTPMDAEADAQNPASRKIVDP